MIYGQRDKKGGYYHPEKFNHTVELEFCLVRKYNLGQVEIHIYI